MAEGCTGVKTHGVGDIPPNTHNLTTISEQNVITIGATEEHSVAKVEGAVDRVWMQVVQAEERTKFLQTLVREGFGTHDVEHFRRKQADRKFGSGKGERNEDKVCEDMKEKLKDNIEWEEQTRGKRGKLRAKLEKMIGSKSNRYRKFIGKLKDRMDRERRGQQQRYGTKIAKLRVEYKKKTRYKIPPELERYKDVSVFNSDSEIQPEKLRGPVVVGEKGKLVLNGDEKDVLTRGPKFTLRRCLNKERFMIEMEKSLLKEKWDRSQREDKGEELVDMEREEKDRIDKIAEEMTAKSRQVFDGEDKVLDFANHKATDAKMNTRVILPRPLTPKEEADLEVRRAIWSSLFDAYIKGMADEDGVQESNLTVGEQRGLKSLKKRVKSGEIVICQTDKSGRFAVLTLEDYERAGMKHVQGDQEVDMEYVKQNNRVLNGHCSMWLRIFLVGANWGTDTERRNSQGVSLFVLFTCCLKITRDGNGTWEALHHQQDQWQVPIVGLMSILVSYSAK